MDENKCLSIWLLVGVLCAALALKLGLLLGGVVVFDSDEAVVGLMAACILPMAQGQKEEQDTGRTALHLAAAGGHIETAEFLIEKGAEVNARDINGNTPLHEAAARGHDGTALMLIGKGAEVNAKNKDGITPVELAAQNGHQKMVEVLLTNGAEVDGGQDKPQFAVTLSNGVEVEYLGFSEWDEDRLCWWGPDGERTSIAGVYEADVDGLGTVLAFRLGPGEVQLNGRTFQGPGAILLSRIWRIGDSNVWLVTLNENRRFVNLELDIKLLNSWESTGPAAVRAEDFRRDSLARPAVARGGGMFHLLEDGEDYFRLGFYGRGDEEVRSLEALTQEGQLIAVSSSGRNPWRFTGASLEELGSFRWERRRIENQVSVKFRNISLIGGRKAEMVIEVDGADYEKRQKMSASRHNMSVLGMAMINYRQAHSGIMPEGLDTEVLGPYLEDDKGGVMDWIKANVQYLSKGMDVKGMAAPIAGRTPAAYDKVRLKENEGTVILFIDGSVRWVGRDELSRYGTDPERIVRGERLQYSAEKLTRLGSAVLRYADDHEQVLPSSLTEAVFSPYITESQDGVETYAWLTENVQYILKGRQISEIRDIFQSPAAYDRNLLKVDEGTNVLFLDKSVRFILKGDLGKYGIEGDKEVGGWMSKEVRR